MGKHCVTARVLGKRFAMRYLLSKAPMPGWVDKLRVLAANDLAGYDRSSPWKEMGMKPPTPRKLQR